MSQANIPRLLKPVKPPKSVQEVLRPNEQVIHKLSWGRDDYYATDERILAFTRPAVWVGLFGLLGLLAQKTYSGHIEYSRISGITFNSYRPKPLVVFGIVVGVLFVVLSITSFVLPGEGNWIFGILCLVFGLLSAGFFCTKKVKLYQVEGIDLTKAEVSKWRFYNSNNTERFVSALKEAWQNKRQ